MDRFSTTQKNLHNMSVNFYNRLPKSVRDMEYKKLKHASLTNLTAISSVAWFTGARVRCSANSVNTSGTHRKAVCFCAVRSIACAAHVNNSLPELGLREKKN
ncbi:hypothetical protein C0J52_20337 [Blattella germanica]|nr:hypothetical protein C0J52_20337 [Blattella germanica]